jgi:hypothetical protein
VLSDRDGGHPQQVKVSPSDRFAGQHLIFGHRGFVVTGHGGKWWY